LLEPTLVNTDLRFLSFAARLVLLRTVEHAETQSTTSSEPGQSGLPAAGSRFFRFVLIVLRYLTISWGWGNLGCFLATWAFRSVHIR
jgi:hypothetical protein